MKRVLLWLIKAGASAPKEVKGGFFEKVFTRILRTYRTRYTADRLIRSNLGMDNGLKTTVSVLHSPGFLLFGAPRSYSGEYHTLQLVGTLSRHCSAFVDIGANWGYYTFFIATRFSKPVYWFEPNPALYHHITGNTAKNKMQHVTGSDAAISDTTGHLTFYIDQSSDLQSSIIRPGENISVKEHTVQSLRFDNWAASAAVPGNLLVKVDVENAEWNFIRGATAALDKIEFLVMEVLAPARESGFINYVISGLGLQAYYINKNKIEHVSKDDMRYTTGEYNWLFCRYQPDELQKSLAGSMFEVTK
jgi:FkbM family methyltransferase